MLGGRYFLSSYHHRGEPLLHVRVSSKTLTGTDGNVAFLVSSVVIICPSSVIGPRVAGGMKARIFFSGGPLLIIDQMDPCPGHRSASYFLSTRRSSALTFLEYLVVVRFRLYVVGPCVADYLHDCHYVGSKLFTRSALE